MLNKPETDINNILVVDDEEEARLGLAKLLSVKGYRVFTASNGVEALEVLRNQPTSMIITDIKMPEMDGLTFLKEIKKIIPDVNVVIVTGYGEVEAYLEAMNLGAFEFLHKPIQFDDLIKVINKSFRD
ncbi:response regulator [Thermodesulfobacteriota bacterium]